MALLDTLLPVLFTTLYIFRFVAYALLTAIVFEVCTLGLDTLLDLALAALDFHTALQLTFYARLGILESLQRIQEVIERRFQDQRQDTIQQHQQDLETLRQLRELREDVLRHTQ